MKITVETSCGQIFVQTPDEMSDRQLEGLISQNADNPDKEDQAAVAAMRAEVERRKGIFDGTRTKIMTEGECFDDYGDMLTPAEIVEMLDGRCWPETLVGIYQLLHTRFRDDPKAQAMLSRDLSEIDPGYFEFVTR